MFKDSLSIDTFRNKIVLLSSLLCKQLSRRHSHMCSFCQETSQDVHTLCTNPLTGDSINICGNFVVIYHTGEVHSPDHSLMEHILPPIAKTVGHSIIVVIIFKWVHLHIINSTCCYRLCCYNIYRLILTTDTFQHTAVDLCTISISIIHN